MKNPKYLCGLVCVAALTLTWVRSARPRADAVDGDFAQRDCGFGVAAGFAGGRADFGERRKRGGRGDCHERHDGRGRADDERDRRGFVRDCVRRQGQQTLWNECQRLGAGGIDDRVFAGAGFARDAADRREFDHGAGRGGWLAETGGQVWTEEIEGGFGGGDSNGAGRFSRCRSGTRRIGRRKWSTSRKTMQRPRFTCPAITRRMLETCSRTRSWRSRWSRSRSMDGTRFTRARSRRKFWTP